SRFNAEHPHYKRGLAITPVKFGISFTATFYNQGGALVLVYRDGSIQVNHGGTEMGQGLHTKIRQIAAESLGVPLDSVRMMPTRTKKAPNTRPAAASAPTDRNGAAGPDACRQFCTRFSAMPGEPFPQRVEAPSRQSPPLFAAGYYPPPAIHFDPKAGRG